MSYVVVGIIWVWIYDYDWGLANVVLRSLGLGAFEQSWLGDPATALWSVLVTHLWKWLGFNMIIFLAALYALPGEVLGAAELDNCGWFAKLVYIIIPMLRPTIVNLTGAVLHRQDDDLRPRLDHDRWRAAVVDRDGLDLRLQARLRLEHLRSRLPVGDRRALVSHHSRLHPRADAACCASARGSSSELHDGACGQVASLISDARRSSLFMVLYTVVTGGPFLWVAVDVAAHHAGDLREPLRPADHPPLGEVRRGLDEIELRHLFLEQHHRGRDRRRAVDDHRRDGRALPRPLPLPRQPRWCASSSCPA